MAKSTPTTRAIAKIILEQIRKKVLPLLPDEQALVSADTDYYEVPELSFRNGWDATAKTRWLKNHFCNKIVVKALDGKGQWPIHGENLETIFIRIRSSSGKFHEEHLQFMLADPTCFERVIDAIVNISERSNQKVHAAKLKVLRDKQRALSKEIEMMKHVAIQYILDGEMQ